MVAVIRFVMTGVLLTAAFVAPAAGARADASGGTPVVNLALTGSVSSDTAAEGRAAASAADGDAATA